jgi:hypothetical protein
MVRPQATASRMRLQNTGPLYTKGASTDALLKKLKVRQESGAVTGVGGLACTPAASPRCAQLLQRC